MVFTREKAELGDNVDDLSILLVNRKASNQGFVFFFFLLNKCFLASEGSELVAILFLTRKRQVSYDYSS